jgi:hypothetical protein
VSPLRQDRRTDGGAADRIGIDHGFDARRSFSWVEQFDDRQVPVLLEGSPLSFL